MRKVPFKDDEVIEFTTLETSCVYLKDKRMQMSYKYIKDCSLSLSSKLTKRGWRRFGHYYSKPNCIDCDECKSIRIDVDNFHFSKSARRVIKKNEDTDIIIRKPTISKEHLTLYEKYHKYMQETKNWEYYPLNNESYADLYAKGFSTFGYEILYIRDKKLVGVDIVDFLRDGISSIYFYYDPSFREYSLGKYSIYKQIEFAKKRELKWIYIGYSVKNCPSLNYKEKYKPYQVLQNSPSLDCEAIWSFD
jgi:arginine-tRNA-protein transferase